MEDSIPVFDNIEYECEFRQIIQLNPSWLYLERCMFRLQIWRYLEMSTMLKRTWLLNLTCELIRDLNMSIYTLSVTLKSVSIYEYYPMIKFP